MDGGNFGAPPNPPAFCRSSRPAWRPPGRRRPPARPQPRYPAHRPRGRPEPPERGGPLGQCRGDLPGLVGDVVAVLPPRLGHPEDQALELLPGKVGAAEERVTVRGHEHGHRPAALAGHRLGRGHVDGVHVGPLLPVDLDRDQVLVHERGGLRVLERLVRHHMAPVARRIPHGQQDGDVAGPGGGEGLRGPGPPVHGVVRVLQQVRAGGVLQSGGHDSILACAPARPVRPLGLCARPARAPARPVRAAAAPGRPGHRDGVVRVASGTHNGYRFHQRGAPRTTQRDPDRRPTPDARAQDSSARPSPGQASSAQPSPGQASTTRGSPAEAGTAQARARGGGCSRDGGAGRCVLIRLRALPGGQFGCHRHRGRRREPVRERHRPGRRQVRARQRRREQPEHRPPHVRGQRERGPADQRRGPGRAERPGLRHVHEQDRGCGPERGPQGHRRAAPARIAGHHP